VIQVRRVWRHVDEREALPVLIANDRHRRHIKLQRASNAVFYDFLVEQAAIPLSPDPGSAG